MGNAQVKNISRIGYYIVKYIVTIGNNLQENEAKLDTAVCVTSTLDTGNSLLYGTHKAIQ